MKLGRVTDGRFQMALTKLAALPIPLRAAFKLKGITNRINEEAKKFEDVRQQALKTYGLKDEAGNLLLDEENNVKFGPGQLQLFAKELNDLGSTEIDLGTLSVAELGEKLTLTADDVIALDGVLVE